MLPGTRISVSVSFFKSCRLKTFVGLAICHTYIYLRRQLRGALSGCFCNVSDSKQNVKADSPNERCILRHDFVQPAIVLRLVGFFFRQGRGEAVTGSWSSWLTACRRSKRSGEGNDLYSLFSGAERARVETIRLLR